MIRLSPKEVKNKLNEGSAMILDVREAYECNICKIDSMHIPMADVASRKNEIPTDKTVVVMCRTGRRAEAVANMMICEMGFENVALMEGGIIAWAEQIDNQLEQY